MSKLSEIEFWGDPGIGDEGIASIELSWLLTLGTSVSLKFIRIGGLYKFLHFINGSYEVQIGNGY